MWHYSYTSIWFNKIIEGLEKSNISLEKTQFVMILLQELNRGIIDFLEKHYCDLDTSSSLPLQIFAPVKPPKFMYDDPFGPEFPLEHHEERYSFFESLKEAGISQHDLPKIILFTLQSINEEDYEFVNIKCISLREIEYGRSISYNEFFSELINMAHDSYMKGDFDPNGFANKVARRFKPMFFEERIRSLPILGKIYKKRIG